MNAKSALSVKETVQQLRTPRLDGDDVAAKRREIADYFNANFDRYESLFETLKDDSGYYQKSIPLR
ncbi:MAG TPA: hypothetical protein VFM76_07580, partial [Methylophaga sp.]|nr:hypothetical protein [Methylophaga sp.]